MSAEPAAVGPRCGQTVTSSFKLTKDLGPCRGDGLVVTANGITVDLGGHTIRGDGDPAHTPDQVGVRLQGTTGVRVVNGTARDFDAGLAIERGSSKNLVTGMTLTHNVGSGTSLHGDGILIDGSTDNQVRRTTVTANGPYDGIGLFNGAVGNVIAASSITDNNVITSIPGQDDAQLDSGINLADGSGTVIDGNQILRNGSDGISPGANTGGRRVTNNVVRDNGHVGLNAGGIGGDLVSGNIFDHNGYDQFRPAGAQADTGGGIWMCGACFVPGALSIFRDNVVTANHGAGISMLFNGFLYKGDYHVPRSNLVQHNVVRGNTGDGIYVQCEETFDTTLHCTNKAPAHKGLRILDNTTGGNGGSGAGTTAWDLHDGNLHCDDNVWRGNTFQTANPACTKG